MNKKFTLSHLRLCILLTLSCFAFSNGNAQTLPAIQCKPVAGAGACNLTTTYYTITNVQYANLNIPFSPTSCTNTTVYPDTAKLCGGVTDSMFVTTTGDVGIGVYIDTDNDGYFDKPGEFIYGAYPAASGGVFAFPFNIPAGTRPGLHYMRIVCGYQYPYTAADPCYGSLGWGDFTDMYIDILDTTHITAQPQSLAGCLKTPVAFTVASQGQFLTYQWYKNGVLINGAPSSPTYNIPSFNAVDTGDYSVVVSNACATSTSTTAKLTIHPAPTARLFTHGPLSFCPGGSVALSGDTIGHGYTYRWLYNGVVQADTTYLDTVSLPGTYRFVISNGCSDTSSIDTVVNFPTGVPTITPAVLTKVCAVNPVPFATPAGPAGKVHYQWQINTGTPNAYANIANDTTVGFSATQTGFYRLQLRDSNSCISYSAGTALQENSPAIVNISTLQSLYLCSGGFITITASSSDTGEKYKWQYNGATIFPNVTTSSYNAYQAGSYSVLGNNGCSVASAPIIVTLIPSPHVVVGGPTVFCGGGTVLLSSDVTDTTLRYQWLKNNNIIPGATSPLYTALDSGSYSVVVISNNTCTAGSTAINVIVHALPNPVINIGADNLTLTVTPFFHFYQWYNGTTAIQGATHASYVAHTAGLYSVAVTDDNGCTGTSAQVQAIGDVAVGSVPTPESVSIYPNPATSVVHITAPISVNVSLTTMDGRVLLNKAAAKDINISNLADGIYMIRVADTNGNTIKIEKLVKANQ